LSRRELAECFKIRPAAEECVLTAVLAKYNYAASRNYHALSDTELIDKVAVNFDGLSKAALIVAKDNKRFAVVEIRNRMAHGSLGRARTKSLSSFMSKRGSVTNSASAE
jgi:hypothetical protein